MNFLLLCKLFNNNFKGDNEMERRILALETILQGDTENRLHAERHESVTNKELNAKI